MIRCVSAQYYDRGVIVQVGRPVTLQEYWSSDADNEFLDKWFSISKISQYFRTRWSVMMVDIDG